MIFQYCWDPKILLIKKLLKSVSFHFKYHYYLYQWASLINNNILHEQIKSSFNVSHIYLQCSSVQSFGPKWVAQNYKWKRVLDPSYPGAPIPKPRPSSYSRLGAAIWPWLSVIETEAVLETKLKIKLANVLKIKNKFTDKLHLPDTQLLRGPKDGGPTDLWTWLSLGFSVFDSGLWVPFLFGSVSGPWFSLYPRIWTPASVSALEVLQFDVFYASFYSMKSTWISQACSICGSANTRPKWVPMSLVRWRKTCRINTL